MCQKIVEYIVIIKDIDCLTVKRSNQGGACGVAMDIDAVAAGCVVVLAVLGCSGLMTWRCAGGVLKFVC